ncbi:GRB10-interacting GYF protein 2 isoform X3 [Bufo gargarizans]|uniref:GRB10-interacting GYF protein 2 isoform X3 n=1 Tax=Bufo gargarizans TaxID=30331 RepID=UPI001CF0E9A6|nr:GRB10-interacting GYF protein 2 isoform X3 [Bufo gargarizans]
MTAETQTLTFGPEWLRALSSGGSVISPPLSPALPKYKLADYRYGREEMLALYIKDNKVPSDLLDKEFLPILKEEPLLPLALVPFTEEEQRNFSMSVNSAAVLRLMGRGTGGGGGTVVGAPRGRSSSRGRGRGRGESGFYQRSFDEVESGFGRGAREMHRSQSWEERGDRRFEKPARKEPDGARGPGWREHPDRRRRFDFDFRERDDERGHRRTRSGSGSAEDERDCLPEWCLEDAEDETGTFDSSGAFLPSKKVQKESIPEEQELDFRPSLDGEEHSDSDGSNFEDAKEKEVVQVPEQSSETSKNDSFGEGQVTNPSEMEHRTPSPAKKTETKADSPVQNTTPPMASSIGQEAKLHTNLSAPAPPTHKEESVSPGSRGSLESTAPSISHSPSAFSQSSGPQQVKDPQQGPAVHSPLIKSEISSGPSPPSVCAAPGMGTLVSEPDEDDGLEHLEQQAQQMVAYLQDGALDDERLTGKAPDHRVKGHSPENQQKWYYKDPQGEIQGPFSNREMAEWYQAGYFPITLLLRRVCDETFQPLGDIIKLWGRVPFITPPAPRLGELGPEHIGRHQEMTALYQLQQLHYQQFLIQQQYTQVMAQQQKAALSSQQQQQLALLLQQFQTLKMRISEQPVVPPLPRAMSVPDNTSLWELQTAAPPPSLWEGSSVWDLPIESVSQGATREQLEKAKAAKIEQERREAELRAKQEEEEQRRRLEEEERKRKEELELARRKQEEALRRQREQELALRRQIEEEERKREDERRLLEERRRQEEERRRQEEEKRRLEEERKRLEEERKRKEEEKKREEEEKRKREELRKQEEAAKWAREEEEAARRLMEETRLRQEEEELKKREEAQRQKELQRQRQQQQEALRRLQQLQQQQQLAQMKLPSSSTWGQQVNSGGASQSTLSLAEIQKLEEERERQNQEEQRRQHQELRSVQQQQQQQQQQQKTPGWGNVVKPTVNTKSLVEIQQEEARQMQKMHQQAGRGRPANVTLPPAPTPVPNPVNSVSSSGSSVWGNLNNNMSPQWSPDSVSSIWSSPEIKTSTGFWDDAVKVVAPRNAVNKNKSNSSKSSGVNSRQSKKVEQEEKLVRLFQGAAKCADGFNQWCEQTLHALSTAHSLDVPTFVSFLREVESAYEVHDYVRAYLGDTPEAKDFSKQFLERRNKQKTVPQKPQQDSAWPVFQTSPNNLQQTTLETAQSAGRKKKKQKMVRADPSLLGFSVNASSERLNMGEIETLEDY